MRFKYLILSAIVIILFHSKSYAQEQFKLNASASNLVITGTSSIHDWEMEAEEFKCDAVLTTAENTIKEIVKIDFVCPVEMLKSKNKIMDNKTYKALKSDDFSEILFQVDKKGEVQNVDGISFLTGHLSLAGSKKEIDVEFEVREKDEKQLIVSGELPLKMSDFDIKPPTAMMGTLKTGDEVVIKYEFVFSVNSEQTVGIH